MSSRTHDRATSRLLLSFGVCAFALVLVSTVCGCDNKQKSGQASESSQGSASDAADGAAQAPEAAKIRPDPPVIDNGGQNADVPTVQSPVLPGVPPAPSPSASQTPNQAPQGQPDNGSPGHSGADKGGEPEKEGDQLQTPPATVNQPGPAMPDDQ